MPQFLFVLAALAYIIVAWLVFVFFTVPAALILGPLGVPAGFGLTMVTFAEVLLGMTTTRICGPEQAAQHEIGELPGVVPVPGDRAWPNYFVRQVRHDVGSVEALVASRTKRLWRLAHAWTSGIDGWVIAVCLPLLLPFEVALASATVAAAALFLAGTAVIAVVTAAAWAVGALCCTVLRLREQRRARRLTTDACCVRCHHVTRLPTFQCPGDHPEQSEALHRDIRPGLRGVFWRRCGCGQRIPTTVRRAAESLQALCPLCLAPLPAGSGAVTDVRIAFFGASSAGQTSLILSSLTAIAERGQTHTVAVEPVGDDSAQQVRSADELRTDGVWPKPTGDSRRAEVTTLRLRSSGPGTLLHLFDTPGRALVDPVLNEQFAFLESARTLVFVISPLQLPKVAALLGRADPDGPARSAVATDPEDVYQASVNRLRLWGVPTSRQRLAVVLTNADLLARLREQDRPAGSDSKSTRNWLVDLGRLDNVVWAAERDFGRVRFFQHSAGSAPAEAIGLLRWLLRAERSRPRKDLDVVR